MKELDSKVVEVNDEIIKKTVILRLNEVREGFQRKLDTGRVSAICEALRDDPRLAIPPILLADTGKGYVLVDGQHRFEARKRMVFLLHAQIVKMDEQEAAKTFIVTNSTSRKVSLQHRLRVDPSEFGTKLRGISMRFGVKPNYIWHMIRAINSRYKDRPDLKLIGMDEWEFVELVLREWTNDKRWKEDKGVYATPGILRVVTYLSKHKDKPKEFIGILKKMNFNDAGTLAQKYGMSSWKYTEMKNYVTNWLATQG